ncbi:unnamed protein product [Effrenium voratum]|uniref:Uncharacterized protein n=1 Tax=Effrenium voratum TaxID=2562239 RepID=A0AA36IHN7_9DINO|nr:unnamed protein product [Effrenium voratum]
MARVITVHCAPSGKEEAFELEADMTAREFKRQLHRWLPCGDDSQRNMSSVEVVVGETPLSNNEEMVSEAIPGAEVLAFLSIKPVKCSRARSSSREIEDLRVVEITDVGEVAPCAFLDCRFLASVVIPDSVTVIKNSAFVHCSSLKSVAIPDSVTRIECWAFKGCSSLESVTIPNSVIHIGFGAFEDCSSLTSVTIPTVTQIESGTFANCSSLTSVRIPDTVTEIGKRAFRGCSSLPSTTIPSSVTKIGKYAFEHCSSLASVTIPDSVTRIGKGAFAGCDFPWDDESNEESESDIDFDLFD